MRSNICPVSRDKKLSPKKLSDTCLLIMPRFHSVWKLCWICIVVVSSFFLFFFSYGDLQQLNSVTTFPICLLFFVPMYKHLCWIFCSKRELTGGFFLTIMSNGRMGILVSSPGGTVWGMQDQGCFSCPQVCTLKYGTAVRHLCLNPLPIWEIP